MLIPQRSDNEESTGFLPSFARSRAMVPLSVILVTGSLVQPGTSANEDGRVWGNRSAPQLSRCSGCGIPGA